jgi:hypothetical protein
VLAAGLNSIVAHVIYVPSVGCTAHDRQSIAP